LQPQRHNREDSSCRRRKFALSSGVSKLRNFLTYWLPPAIWMVVIFSFSGDAKSYQHSGALFGPLLHWLFPTLPGETIEQIHHRFRKCAHLTVYGILALLFWRAIHQPRRNEIKPWRWDEAGLVLASVFLYAASDELHQVFVPGRTALVSDVFIDSSGGLAGLLAIWLARKIFRRA
jgi:VanZ family protein